MTWKPRYKQLCAICKKSHVLISSYRQFPICTQCSMRQIDQPIEEKKFRKMFDIDPKLYEQSSFLRSIKSNYLRYKELSQKQVETFKRVAAELANPERNNKSSAQAAPATAAAVANEKAESTGEKIKKPKPKSRKTKK